MKELNYIPVRCVWDDPLAIPFEVVAADVKKANYAYLRRKLLEAWEAWKPKTRWGRLHR